MSDYRAHSRADAGAAETAGDIIFVVTGVRGDSETDSRAGSRADQ